MLGGRGGNAHPESCLENSSQRHAGRVFGEDVNLSACEHGEQGVDPATQDAGGRRTGVKEAPVPVLPLILEAALASCC